MNVMSICVRVERQAPSTATAIRDVYVSTYRCVCVYLDGVYDTVCT